MKHTTIFLLTGLIAASVIAAPAPYPVTVNSRSARAPDILAFAGNRMVYRVTFKDGGTASNIGSETPFLHWAVSATSTTFTAASASVVDSTNGIVDFTFVPSNLNYAAGTYIYEVGIKTGADVPKMYRQGTFALRGSPTGTGVGTNFPSTINWATYDYQATATHGPVRATGTGQTTSTNADGSITINIPAGAISTLLPGIAIDIITNGTTYTIQVDGTEAFNASGATNANATTLFGSGTIPNQFLDIDAVVCVISLTNAQSNIANAVWTQVELNNVEIDTDSLADIANYRITFDRSGIWSVGGTVNFFQLTAGRDAMARVRHERTGSFTNTVALARGTGSTPTSVGLPTGSIEISGQSGDHITLEGLHQEGAATPDFNGLDPYSGQVWLKAKYVGAE